MMFQRLRAAQACVAAWDQRWSARMAGAAREHRALYHSSAVLAHAGDGALWLGIGLVALIAGRPTDRWVLAPIAAAVALTALLVTAIKFSARRRRPEGSASARWSSLPRYDVYSFPSGHAARVACIALCASSVYPGARLPLLAWAVGVCLARVALSAHYLFDVLVGAILGGAVAAFVGLAWPAVAIWLQAVAQCGLD